MSAPDLWLASGSPRRRQLLDQVGLSVGVCPADADERLLPDEAPEDAAQRLARAKLVAAPPDGVALAADTLVHADGEAFGKPDDDAHARRMLRALSGRWHRVTTGVAVRSRAVEVFAVTSDVRFRALSDAEIARYVASGEPRDKAGAYGIQGLGGALVAELRGSWTNVMGLPLEETLAALARAGIVR